MIAYIKGTVEQITDQSVVLENNHIGYIIGASAATLSRLPQKGELTQLFTYMQVREDDISLFGFLSQEEINLFRLLITISGIGAKVALAILGLMSPEQIITAIVSQDSVAFSKVPGVGKKTAQRITLELQDKIKRISGFGAVDSSLSPSTLSTGEKQDAIDALLALGYSRSESLKAVLSIATEDHTAEQIIRLALKKLI